MKNNTVVIASEKSYFWGVYLLIASMRFHRMDEPVLVFQNDFPPEMKRTLLRFSDVTLVEAPPSPRNMTCRKPEAMLYAKTDFVTWCDADGFFTGNCSDKLYIPDPEVIQVRMRNEKDTAKTFLETGLYDPDDRRGDIPRRILEAWRDDVGEGAQSRLPRTVSACYFSLSLKRHRDFLERYQLQTEKVLPESNVGVTDASQRAYYQLDESVLNSLLCFSACAPRVCDEYRMDTPIEALYCHLGGYPKPWVWWSAGSFRHHERIMQIIGWAQKNVAPECSLPLAFNPRFSRLHARRTLIPLLLRIGKRLNRLF